MGKLSEEFWKEFAKDSRATTDPNLMFGVGVMMIVLCVVIGVCALVSN